MSASTVPPASEPACIPELSPAFVAARLDRVTVPVGDLTSSSTDHELRSVAGAIVVSCPGCRDLAAPIARRIRAAGFGSFSPVEP